MKFFNPRPTELNEVLSAIEQSSGHIFSNRNLLLEALHHSSYASEQTPPIQSNERLEFLGDAVLELIVSRRLFSQAPTASEGRMTQMRSMLVDENANSANCMAIGLDKALFLGRGEEMNGGRTRKSLLGDAFEAFLGAVYLDGGFDEADAIIRRLWEKNGTLIPEDAGDSNPKGMLQELCQALPTHLRPKYIQTAVTGPVHAPHFDCDVLIGDRVCGHGHGPSKKHAENDAASQVLAHWEELKTLLAPPADDNKTP